VNGWRGGESEEKREEIAEDVGNGLGGRTSQAAEKVSAFPNLSRR